MDLRNPIWIFEHRFDLLIDYFILTNSACVSKAWGVNDHEGWVSWSPLYEILSNLVCDGTNLVCTSFINYCVTKAIFSLNTKTV